MNLIDDDAVRHHLRALADEAQPLIDPLPDIRRRADRMGRRRVAGAAVAAAVLVAAAVTVAPTFLHHRAADDDQVSTATSGPTVSPTPPARPSPGPTSSAGAVAPVFGHWRYDGDRDLEAAASETDFGPVAAAALAHTYPGAALTDNAWLLWGGSIGPKSNASGLLEVQEIRDGSTVRDIAVLYLRDGTTGYAAVVQQVTPDATQISLVVPQGPGVPVPYVLVVGAPGTGSISYASSGTSFTAVQNLPGFTGSLGPSGEGWAVFPRGAKSGDAVQLRTAGDGTIRYSGPIGAGAGGKDG